MAVTEERRPDLLVLIAIWEFLSAFGVLVLVTFILGGAFLIPTAQWGGDWYAPRMAGFVIFALSVGVLTFGVYFVIALLGGIWLLQGREMGRILSIIHAAISAFWVPIGTVIGILILLYLTRPDVRGYFKA